MSAQVHNKFRVQSADADKPGVAVRCNAAKSATTGKE